MHEVFLTTFIEAEQLEQARAVLQGYCAMSAHPMLTHVVFFHGPATRPVGLPNMKQYIADQKPDRTVLQLWNELAKILARQSFAMQVRYPARSDGSNAPDLAADRQEQPGTLRWADIPDATNKDAVKIRKVVEIVNQRHLVGLLRSNGQTLKKVILEESYRYYDDGIEYSLIRDREASSDSSTPATPFTLPSLADSTPIDPAGRWRVQIRAVVIDDSTPDSIRAAHEKLLTIQTRFQGVLDFPVFDRRVHDTRIAPRISETPIPLPRNVVGARGSARP